LTNSILTDFSPNSILFQPICPKNSSVSITSNNIQTITTKSQNHETKNVESLTWSISRTRK